MNIRFPIALGVAFVLIIIGAGISGDWNPFTRNLVLFAIGYAVAIAAVGFDEAAGR